MRIKLLFGFLAITMITIFSCQKILEPQIAVERIGDDEVWQDDTVGFSIVYTAFDQSEIKIEDNINGQVYSKQVEKGADMLSYTYTVPSNVKDGDLITLTFTITSNNGSSASETKDLHVSEMASNRYVFHSGTISYNETWTADKIHIITDDLRVDGCTLTIKPGTVVKFESDEDIELKVVGTNSALIAEATADSVIVFTSKADNPQPGDWDYIYFDDGSNSSLSYCKIEYGGGNTGFGMVVLDGSARLSITHSDLSKSASYLVYNNYNSSPGFTDFHHNTLTLSGGHLIHISGKIVHTLGDNNTYNYDNNFGILVSGCTAGTIYLTSDVTWKKQDIPFYIVDDIVIRNSATLTLNPGVVLKMGEDLYIQVGFSSEYARLVAVGNSTDSIYITSDNPTPRAGDWRYIRFTTNSLNGSKLQYCNIGYGGLFTYEEMIEVYPAGDGNPVISNCHIHHSGGYGIYKKKYSGVVANPNLYSNTYNDNASGDVVAEE